MSKAMAMVNAFNPEQAGQLSAHEQEMIRRRQAMLGPAYRLFYERPVHIVRGEGVWLYDRDGKAYLDAYNNVAGVGHCHPKVVAALTQQAAILNTHTRYLHDGILDYAEKLLAKFPAALGHVMFTCTGSEANDLALRIARAHTGRTGLIVTELAYHGLTAAIAEASPSLGDYVMRGKNIRLVPAPDAYRNPGIDIGRKFAADVRAAIDSMRADGIEPAALLVDTIFSSDGVFPEPRGLLTDAVALIRSEGGLFIADEVQPGLARVGEAWWGFARHGVEPDIITMGKPMGNGHPIAGAVMRPHLVSEFGRRARYFNTFGGNPVSCAVGNAVLEAIEEEGLAENAERTGAYLRDGIRALAKQHQIIGDVRGAGLFVGVELVSDASSRAPAGDAAIRIVNTLRANGVLISATGPRGNILKIRPPLVFSRDNADLLLDRFEQALNAAQ